MNVTIPNHHPPCPIPLSFRRSTWMIFWFKMKIKQETFPLNFPNEPRNKKASDPVCVLEQILLCFMVGCIYILGIVISFSSQPRRSPRARWQRAEERGHAHHVFLNRSQPDRKSARHDKNILEGGSVFTFLAAEWLLYHSACLMIKRGSGCRQNCPQLPRGWVRVCANVRWPHAVVLWLAARNPVHGPCAVPHALPCPAVYIRYVSGNGNVRKLHKHRELFQVSTALLLASPCAPGSWHCFGSLFVSYLFFFFNLNYCFLTHIGEGSREKSLRPSISAMH